MKKMTKTEGLMEMNLELTTENKEKKKWNDELVVAYRELVFLQYEQDKQVAELVVLI